MERTTPILKRGDIPAHLLEEHNKLQSKRRQQLAEQSRDIDIWGSTDIINTRTYLRAQGYLEKLSLTRDEPPPDIRQVSSVTMV